MSSTIPFPPLEQLCNRYCNNKHTHTCSPMPIHLDTLSKVVSLHTAGKYSRSVPAGVVVVEYFYYHGVVASVVVEYFYYYHGET